LAIDITPFDAPLGAEVTGLDFNDPLAPETVAAINRAFLDRHVLCIRDQDIPMERYIEIARAFGEPMVQKAKYFAHPDTDLISVVSPEVNRTGEDKDAKRLVRGTTFHTDHSYWPQPCKATMLHGITVPSKGGETRFCDMHKAYDGLSDELRGRIAGLKGIHRIDARRQKTGRTTYKRYEAEEGPTGIHPLVRTHDETGEKAVYINPNRMNGIDGWTDADSDALLDALEAACIRPEYQYHHKWRKHDILIWDNRSVMHAASDNFTEPRRLHRVLLQGKTPE
jgi:taurine dioxygenase